MNFLEKTCRAICCIAFILTISTNGEQKDEKWEKSLNSVQIVYQNGVPHTDSKGQMLRHYDNARSFFPIGIYHALDKDSGSGVNGFNDLKKAGFNYCHFWEGLSSVETVRAIGAAGLQAIVHHPTIETVSTLKDNPAVLAWYLDEEPTGSYWEKDMEGKFKAFQDKYKKIKEIDPKHPVFILDCAWITPPATQWWAKWNSAGDITAHDNYPIPSSDKPVRGSLSFDQGIPETVSLAVSLSKEEKPMWFCSQAHSVKSTHFGLSIPTPAQERAMVYTALIHGATGIIYFGLDSFVLRSGDCVGIAPEPPEKYNRGIKASKLQREMAKKLWSGIIQLNTELSILAPSILSSTSKMDYEVFLNSKWKPISSNPIRTLLKNNPNGGMTLLLVNIDNTEQLVKIKFPKVKRLSAIDVFSKNACDMTDGSNEFELYCPAFDARAISIEIKELNK